MIKTFSSDTESLSSVPNELFLQSQVTFRVILLLTELLSENIDLQQVNAHN